MLREWDRLPQSMRTEEVRPYYEKLEHKKISLFLKRVFDIVMSALMLIILSPMMIVVSTAIVLDSKGGVFFRQERVTQYGRKFKIFKFRTMVLNAEQLGTQVTVKNDMRVTKVGAVLRKFRIDEFPQLINILLNDMSFVGTRPEVTRYVKRYTPEMMATLLLPAGITSEASIRYKDEDKLLEVAADVEDTYVNKVLPEKMKYNLKSIKEFSFIREIGTMLHTVVAVIK
ncbi:sugar transferase [Caproicibacterium sp. BJN0003]|uniref:sugar transferase n=1 Tax=Caproicibacterium sp. BJN0003 TaxID=2994078 RepID=UPI00224F89EC|nr:sugar transferase [Caproicibacterium sp. BJN0003]UZT81973.1 sugar transferase [Caproicibacterium sp. BJN0003]